MDVTHVTCQSVTYVCLYTAACLTKVGHRSSRGNQQGPGIAFVGSGIQ